MVVKSFAPGTGWMMGPWQDCLGGKMITVDHQLQKTSLSLRTNATWENLEKSEIQSAPWSSRKKISLGSMRTNPFPCKTSKQLMPATSAMPSSVKRTCLTQYGICILRNTLEVPWSEKTAMLSEFSARLHDSSYSERFRQTTINSVLKGWDKMVIEHYAGKRPKNPAKFWQNDRRRKNKLWKKHSWQLDNSLEFKRRVFSACSLYNKGCSLYNKDTERIWGIELILMGN